MKRSFKELVQKGKVKQPTQKGFKLSEWTKFWENSESKSEECKNLYKAGLIIFDALGSIRDELARLYKENAPKTSNEELMKYYFAMSNRDRFILEKKRGSYDNKNIFSVTIDNNSNKSEMTLQEVADGCVDLIEKAIYFCKDRKNKEINILPGREPISLIEFISREVHLSQLYGIYESYWHAMLWGDYELLESEQDEKLYYIIQKPTDFEIGYLASSIRKQRLGSQSVAIILQGDLHNLTKSDTAIFQKKNKRLKKIKKINLEKLSHEVQISNTHWRASEQALRDHYPFDIITNLRPKGFSIKEALNVFRCLMIFSYQLSESYPENNEVFTTNKLKSFCPSVNKVELRQGLKEATGYNFAKIIKILDFIEFDTKDKKDIWCHPILSISKTEYILLTSALITPVIERVVEHWMVSLYIDLQDKGEIYENTILQSINESIINNKLITDYETATNKTIKVKSGQEEIDCIARIGDLILVGEAKSIVTSDSPISKFRSKETLLKAFDQVERKAHFIKNNLCEVFSIMSWEYHNEREYKIISFVANSGRMFVGSHLGDVPVVDERILSLYLEDNICPLISGNQIYEHLVWLELYNNFDQLQQNLSKYLKNPPQIQTACMKTTYKTAPIPMLNENSVKLVTLRVIADELTQDDVLNHNYGFNLRISNHAENALKNMDMFI
ncbi:hypothetical protein [Marinobacterium aestuariivivens]|uniref:NERD domain-containing protein n=1 Tax=Marinobacterium aestuariivivens TaxID=1698799 RepID=A0ABW2A748_9GAMM